MIRRIRNGGRDASDVVAAIFVRVGLASAVAWLLLHLHGDELPFVVARMACAGALALILTPLFAYLIAPALGTAVVLLTLLRMRGKRFDAKKVPCPRCGYDLRESLSRCPECGVKLRWGQLYEKSDEQVQ